MLTMRRSDVAELCLLAAMWGASFVFTRLCAADFGPAALVFLRVAGAAALLLTLALWRGEGAALRLHWRPIAVVGLFNSALPFLLFAVGALALNAGLAAIFNATSPLFGALIAWLWLQQRPTGVRVAGLAIGFAGVLGLGLHNASFRPGAHGVSPAWAVAACIGACVLYGFTVNYARQRLRGVPPVAVAAGSQLSAAGFTLLPALWLWPAVSPGPTAWVAAAVLAFVCTGVAYLLYFRLIANAGAQNAISVTFLVPAFAVAWGALFLGERLTPVMVLGCAVIVLGTALATGVIGRREQRMPN